MKIKNIIAKTVGRHSHAKEMNNKKWELRLYVAGKTAKGVTAFNNLKHICDQQLKGKYHIKVIDLTTQPQCARADQILATPTLIRKLPLPVKNIIGDLSDTERVLIGLELSH